MAVITPTPIDVQSGINKAKANAGGVSATQGASYGFGAAAGDQTAANEWMIPVWRNKANVPVGRKGDDRAMGTKAPDRYIEGDAQTQFGLLLLDKGKMADWAKLALRTPGLGIDANNVNDATALGKAWNTAVGWAVNIKAATNGATEVTPFEVADMISHNTGGALLAQQQNAAAHFTGNKTTTSSTTDNRVTSQMSDVLHQMLGRNPTAGETAAYQHGLNGVAAAHPEVTTSVNQYKDGTQVGQTNTVTGGYDQNAAAIQQASSASPDVAKNQQATVFYDALVKAIGAAA